MSVLNMYVDESGTQGDVIATPEGLATEPDHPAYVVGAVLVPDARLGDFEGIVEELAAGWHVGPDELKAKTLYRSHPGFIADIVGVLHDCGFPTMVELNDRRFLLCAQITNLVFRVNPRSEDRPVEQSIKNDLADILADQAPRELLAAFSAICRRPDEVAFVEFVAELSRWLRRASTDPNDLAVEALALSHGSIPMLRLLPDPDLTTDFKRLSALPHIPAIVDLGFRAEWYRRRSPFDEVMVVHDQHSQWSAWLANVAAARELVQDSPGPPWDEIPGFLAYDLSHVTYTTGDSKRVLGIQVADLVAGTVSRAWNAIMARQALAPPIAATVRDLVGSGRSPRCLSVNCVASTSECRRFMSAVGCELR